MMKNLGAFLKDESGSAAVEYGVFAAGISVSILMVIKKIGPKLYGVFSPSPKPCRASSRSDSDPIRYLPMGRGPEAPAFHSLFVAMRR
jgi:pilus assembly protein Flp/PilA